MLRTHPDQVVHGGSISSFGWVRLLASATQHKPVPVCTMIVVDPPLPLCQRLDTPLFPTIQPRAHFASEIPAREQGKCTPAAKVGGTLRGIFANARQPSTIIRHANSGVECRHET